MTQDKTQPTPINAEEYRLFKEFVRDVHGTVRGNLRTELENALREYRESYYGEDRLVKIEEDLATIKAHVATPEADGGSTATPAPDPSPTPSEPNSTRARRTERPAPNQPRSEKIDYLKQELFADTDRDEESGLTTRDEIRRLIESEYNFADDTVTNYVETILEDFEEFGAKPHPKKDGVYAWGARYKQIIDSLREEADDDFETFADAEVER